MSYFLAVSVYAALTWLLPYEYFRMSLTHAFMNTYRHAREFHTHMQPGIRMSARNDWPKPMPNIFTDSRNADKPKIRRYTYAYKLRIYLGKLLPIRCTTVRMNNVLQSMPRFYGVLFFSNLFFNSRDEREKSWIFLLSRFSDCSSHWLRVESSNRGFVRKPNVDRGPFAVFVSRAAYTIHEHTPTHTSTDTKLFQCLEPFRVCWKSERLEHKTTQMKNGFQIIYSISDDSDGKRKTPPNF